MTTTQTVTGVDAIDAALAANAVNAEPKDVAAQVAPAVEPYKLKAFSTREMPWGKLGALSETTHTAAKAAELGGLNFEVELVDAGFKSTTTQQVGVSPWRTVGTKKAVIRKDTEQFFAYVSKRNYTPVQYAEAFAFMDEINPQYVAAGTLGGGRQGFVVARLPELTAVELKLGRHVDPLEMYLVMRTSHDGTRAIEVAAMMLRGRCMNALTLSAFTQGAAQRWAVKHVGKDPMTKLAVATTTLRRSQDYRDSFVQTATALNDITLTMEEAENVLKRVLPDRARRDEQVNAIIHAWRESPTGGFPDTGWGLVNGVGDYFEWGRPEGPRTGQSRFISPLTGVTHLYTNRTAQLLLQRRR